MSRRLVTGVVAAFLALAGAPASRLGAQCCGDCDGDGTVAINELVTAVNSALLGCPDGEPCSPLLATGQSVCYEPAGSAVIPCDPSSGQDGALRAGAALRYTDNGDGTISDLNTGLMWEKKDDNNAGSVHDQDAEYGFADAVSLAASTQPGAPLFLDVLNNFCDDDEATPCTTNADCLGALDVYAGGGLCGHAGHRDWRLPNMRELLSMVEYGTYRPSVAPAFNAGCAPGCGGAVCSCTAPFWYWSSTTYRTVPSYSWTVFFDDGAAYEMNKTEAFRVRAVRGSL